MMLDYVAGSARSNIVRLKIRRAGLIERMNKLLRSYVQENGITGCETEQLAIFLADFQHFCKSRSVDFDEAATLAKSFYIAENI